MDDDQSLAQLMNEQNQELNQLDASQGLPPPGGGANAGHRTSRWMVAGVALIVVAAAVAIYFYEKNKSASASSSASQPMDYTSTSGSTTSSGSSTTSVSAANPAPAASSPPVLGPGSTVTQGSLPSTGNGATTSASNGPSAAQSAVKKYTPTGVAVINNAASHAAQRSLLASGAAVAIPGHSAAINTFDKNMAKAGAISGITKNNVVILNKGTSNSNTVRVLDSQQGVAIPGHSAAINTFDKNMAKAGAISGITKNNVVILNKDTSYSNAIRVLDSQQGVALNAGLTPAEVGKIQFQARHGMLTKSAYQYDITHHTAINTAP